MSRTSKVLGRMQIVLMQGACHVQLQTFGGADDLEFSARLDEESPPHVVERIESALKAMAEAPHNI